MVNYLLGYSFNNTKISWQFLCVVDACNHQKTEKTQNNSHTTTQK